MHVLAYKDFLFFFMVIKMYLRTQINEISVHSKKYKCNKIQYSTKKGDNS